MKTNKALKRLAKIEALISDLMERYSKGAVQIREALQDAKAAFAHVKKIIRSQVSSEKARRAPVKQKKAAVKEAAVKTPIAKTVKKSAPIKKATKRAATKKTAPASVPGPAPVQTASKPEAEVASVGK
jgi:hypothetical protein